MWERDHIRVNAICPAITDSQMTANIINSFKETKQAVNTCDDVAKYIVGLELATSMYGKAVYIEGGRGWEFIDGLDASMPTWLGQGPAERIRIHLEHIKQVRIVIARENAKMLRSTPGCRLEG